MLLAVLQKEAEDKHESAGLQWRGTLLLQQVSEDKKKVHMDCRKKQCLWAGTLQG